MTRCSLIVLNYNQRELLLACVASLIEAAGPDDEVIVVDNGSSDGSADAVRERYPSVRLVCLPSNRYIFGLNDGLAVAQGRYVAFCNNDMIVDPGFVEEAVACFTADDIFAVCARVFDRHGKDQGTLTAGEWAHGLLVYRPLSHRPEVTSCFFAVGGQSLYRRDLLVGAVGSIDELLWPMYHEDIELSYRAWRCGYRIVYAPRSVAHHLGGQTSKKVFRPWELRAFVRQNELLTVWKDVDDVRMLLEHAVWLLPRLVAAVARRDRGTVVGYGRAFRRLPAALHARRAGRPVFRQSDRAVLQAVSRAVIEGGTPDH